MAADSNFVNLWSKASFRALCWPVAGTHRMTNQKGGDRREAGHQTAPDQWLELSPAQKWEGR
jgi:hypothetical protein